MMNFFLSLIIASFVGTILCIIQKIFRPITEKIFSQTWHYYTSLIPIFFFLGGTKIISVLINFIQQTINFPMQLFYLQEVVHYSEGTRLINQLMSQSAYISGIMKWIIFIWAAGVISFLTVNIKDYVYYKKNILQNYRFYNMEQNTPEIIISVNATAPMVMGFFKPVVILPDIQFNKKELTMILSHEFIHIKRGDLLIKLVIIITKAIHWFNPMIYMHSKQINSYCELSCDEKVVEKMDLESRRSYAEIILSVLDKGVKKRNTYDIDGVINFCNNKNKVKRRLLNIMNVKKMKKSMLALSISVTVLLMGIGAYTAYGYESQLPVTIKLNIVDNDDSINQENESNTSDELTIEVDVPYRMKYQDPYADPPLDIDIQPGEQVLKGDEAEVYLKFRKSN